MLCRGQVHWSEVFSTVLNQVALGLPGGQGPWNIVLHGGLDTPQTWGGELGRILPIMDPLHIPGMV